MFSLTNYREADTAVIKLLKDLSIEVDAAAIVAELEKHPDYPSLLAVSDVLSAFKIDNVAFRAEAGELIDIPCPFIAHMNYEDKDFVVVTKTNSENIWLNNRKWSNHKVTIAEFKEHFMGVVLTAEPSSEALHNKRAFAFHKIYNAPVALVCLLLIFINYFVFDTNYLSAITWQIILLTIFKSAGLITSIFLLVQSIDTNNPLVQILCGGGGKKDCNAILSSKAAKVFEGLSWSEVGFFYFAGTWLLLLFDPSVSIMQVLAILNVISLPYTFYSIYYQARVAKQWCVLCCTVQALLWLEFIPLVTAFNSHLHMPSFAEWSGILVALLFPIFVWALLKPLFLKIQQLQPLKQQLRKFKYNTDLFNRLLKEQPQYTLPDESWSIVLGNMAADCCIIMVTNPYCPPCAKTHKLLDELLNQRSDIQARIVFNATNSDNDIKTPISRHLMALNDLPDKTIVRNALHDWYEQKQKNYEAWAEAYPVQLNENEFHKIDKQKLWCDTAEVTFTPTLLLNGHRMPEPYEVSDLRYMLE
jgi:uncharacterized membrane protein